MMNKDEALKMAIELLESLKTGGENFQQSSIHIVCSICEKALAEQPTQEPSLIQWYNEEDEEWENTDKKYYKHYENEGHKIRFLYTHPKQWQGLSDEEIESGIEEGLIDFEGSEDKHTGDGYSNIARAIEAKLRIKNGY